MNIGDRVLCKNNFVRDGCVMFQENNYYTVTKCWYVNDFKQEFGSYFYVPSNFMPCYWVEIISSLNVRHFSLVRIGDFNYLSDYFFTIPELRKLKIKKLEYKKLII